MKKKIKIRGLKNFFQNKKVVITGHTGFKGIWLSTTLKLFGAKVYGFSLKEPSRINNLKLFNLEKKINTNNEIKVLSSNEIKKIKSDVRKRLNNKDIAKRSIAKKIKTKNLNLKNNKKKEDFKRNNLTNKVIKDKNNVADVCAIIEECSIEEISKYLIKLGKNKGFPNITSRE